MTTSHHLKPDLITWRRESAGVYVSSCGTMRAVKQGGSLWRADRRDDLDSDWQPAATWRGGKPCLWGSLTVAQHEAKLNRGAS